MTPDQCMCRGTVGVVSGPAVLVDDDRVDRAGAGRERIARARAGRRLLLERNRHRQRLEPERLVGSDQRSDLGREIRSVDGEVARVDAVLVVSRVVHHRRRAVQDGSPHKRV